MVGLSHKTYFRYSDKGSRAENRKKSHQSKTGTLQIKTMLKALVMIITSKKNSLLLSENLRLEEQPEPQVVRVNFIKIK